MNEQDLRSIIKKTLINISGSDLNKMIPVEVSARHIHLTQDAIKNLFGKSELTQIRDLSQPGQFLSEERVKLVTSKGEINNVAVLGPARPENQVELAKSDARQLGLNPPIRLSGDISGGEDVVIIGNKGCISAKGSVIIAKSHIHMSSEDGNLLGLKDGNLVDVRIDGERPMTFHDVPVRVGNDFSLAMHIDSDEANACALSSEGSQGWICCKTQLSTKEFGHTEINARKDSISISDNIVNTSLSGLITENKAIAIVKSHGSISKKRTLQLGQSVILTPSARDVFTNAKISLEYVKE